MNNIRLTYSVLWLILGLVSCSQGDSSTEDVVTNVTNKGKVITFRAYLNEGETRADVIDTETFKECCVTCFDPGAKDPTIPYFESEKFLKSGNKFYPINNDPYTWPETDEKLDFFAFYPSIEVMKTMSNNEKCSIVNKSNVVNGKLNIDYYIDNFKVADNIFNQVDFIKAYTSDSLSLEAEKGVLLDFKHQLSRVEIKLYRSQGNYNFQVAGIRLGNPAVMGNYHFFADEDKNPWELPENPYGKVEYIYQPGDTVKTISSHTKENAVPIMGIGGPAMVVPTKNEAWEGKNDPTLSNPGKSMYLSILVNVSLADPNSEGQQIYPAKGIPADDQVKIETFAVDKESGIIKARLNEKDGKFYGFGKETYTLLKSDEVKQFAWAAVPISVDWKRGKKYVYTLNYSNGVGVRDPESPRPGEPVIGGDVSVSVIYNEWVTETNAVDVPQSLNNDNTNNN